MKKLYNWAGKQVSSPYATWIFALLVFTEGFFFMPVNTLLVLFCLEKRNKALLYALLATIASILGGLFGYYIGSLLWSTLGARIVSFLISEDAFNKALAQYKSYHLWGIIVSSFLPIPYKLITLTSGFCRLPLGVFTLGITIGRTVRFFLIGTALYIWGDYIKEIIDRYFYFILALGLLILFVSWWAIH
ncbi:MAG: VTT domain-containing protein [Candidatus Babeliaceae bacterium]|jgi:membrane protein YqaA with SNARE-associated domain